VVDIVSVSAFRERPVTAVVTNRAKVHKIVVWVERMRPVPPGSYNCPVMLAGWPEVTLRFRTRPGGHVLATAMESDTGSGSFACNPLTLRVPGHAVRGLLGGRFLEHLQRLLGVRFGFGSGTITGVIRRTGGTLVAHPAIPSPGAVSLYGVNSLGHRVLVSEEFVPRSGQKFTFTVPPGTYVLQARLPKHPPDCEPTTITVHAGNSTRIAVPAGCSLM
jgi:hypothetical protein